MEQSAKKGAQILECVKAVIIGIIFSLTFVLLAALILKIFNLSNGAIPIINQIIKGISILLGCVIAVKKPNAWLKGIIVGIVYILLSFTVFSLLDGSFEFGLNLLNDVALGAVGGMISGIIAGLKK